MKEQELFSFAAQLDIIHRHRPVAVWVAAVGIVLTLFAAWAVPRRYVSSAFLIVQQSRVPSEYLATSEVGRNPTNDKIENRLGALSQAALSLPNLEELVTRFHLYDRQIRAGLPLGAAAAALAKAVSVTVPDSIVQGAPMLWQRMLPPDSFRISFTYSDPATAQSVMTDLANLFVKEDLKQQIMNAAATTRLIDNQVDLTRAELRRLEQEIKLRKESYRGSLPEDLDIDQRTLETLRSELANLDQALLETGDERRVATTSSGEKVATSPAEQLQSLRTQLSTLQANYRPDYPDVKQVKAQIAALEEQVKNAPLEPALVEDPKKAGLLAKKADVQRQLAELERNIAKIPGHAQELARLTDDLSAVSTQYHQLLDKQLAASMYQNVVRNGEGDRLKLVDPPNLPKTPDFPKIPVFLAIGFGLTVLVAVGLPYLLYFTDSSFKDPREIEDEYELAVLGVIPQLDGIADGTSGHPMLRGASLALLSLAIGVSGIWLFTRMLI